MIVYHILNPGNTLYEPYPIFLQYNFSRFCILFMTAAAPTDVALTRLAPP